MWLRVCALLTFIGLHEQVLSQKLETHGPPRVEKNPMFLDSFIPAAMQIISHATELMKYEIPATETPTTTRRPYTSSHRPGIFAPNPPEISTRRPGPSFLKLGEANAPIRGWLYSVKQHQRRRATAGVDDKDLVLLGKLHADLYRKVNSVDEDFDDLDDEAVVDKFLDVYDDPDGFLRKKKPPPTKAYVTLLSLYDNLNREAKKLGMNKFNGYSRKVLEDLAESAKGTSATQMRDIFSKIVDRKDVNDAKLLTKLGDLVKDLDTPKSYINDALKYIPPLAYDADFD